MALIMSVHFMKASSIMAYSVGDFAAYAYETKLKLTKARTITKLK